MVVVACQPGPAVREFAIVVGIALQNSAIWTQLLVFGAPSRAADVIAAPALVVEALLSWSAWVEAARSAKAKHLMSRAGRVVVFTRPLRATLLTDAFSCLRV